jgi:uncharacterized protein (DUF58 family)
LTAASAWSGGGFEHGVEVVASVAVALLRAGDPVVAVLGEGPARTNHPGNGVVVLLDRLALVAAELVQRIELLDWDSPFLPAAERPVATLFHMAGC